jgi:archaellum biogenesis ATPase FlaH
MNLRNKGNPKGKVVNLSDEVNKLVTEEETNEFLKLMKHNEYSVVEQFKKTFAIILLLSLILSSNPYRKALQNVLNEAYMPQDTNKETIKHLVGKI